MDREKLWDIFENSGKINDYLLYKRNVNDNI